MGEVTNLYFKLSPSPNPSALDICVDVNCKPIGCHIEFFSQTPSFHSVDPPDFGILCSSIPDFACDVHEDQVVDGVGFKQLTCVVIFYEYVWEAEAELGVKDDLLLSGPRLLYLDNFCDLSIFDLSCENSFPYVSIFNHSQDIWDVNLSFDCGEDKYFLFVSHMPLCMIRQIMRMLMYISNFLIVAVMISSILNLITMLIHWLLIFLSHRSLMIYLLKKWKPRKLSRHFSPS